MTRLLFTCFLSFYLMSLGAASNAQDVTTDNCPITPAIWDVQTFSGEIIKSNNMRRKTGSPDFAQGQPIDITGRILDSNCVPITEAVVEIWQADSFGHTFDPEKNESYDPNFAYSGTAVTDNLGYYNFFTLFPGAIGDGAPHINFRIRHADFALFETHMYFPNNTMNDSDMNLKNLVDNSHKILLISNHAEMNNSVTYTFNITLEGVNKYKRY